jgi:hypothetical protein
LKKRTCARLSKKVPLRFDGMAKSAHVRPCFTIIDPIWTDSKETYGIIRWEMFHGSYSRMSGTPRNTSRSASGCGGSTFRPALPAVDAITSKRMTGTAATVLFLHAGRAYGRRASFNAHNRREKGTYDN